MIATIQTKPLSHLPLSRFTSELHFERGKAGTPPAPLSSVSTFPNSDLSLKEVRRASPDADWHASSDLLIVDACKLVIICVMDCYGERPTRQKNPLTL
ncbi:hypothetical protein NA78x_002871 [Anatilimnocola sp. NA78]|uniref:hypothetical protein n=1 Tax=Anatilimnocola sp. NA78 TaxID=3415683 RepID=UPI003CE539D7